MYHSNHQQVPLCHPQMKIQRHKSHDPNYSMRLPGYDHHSPEYKRQKSDSLMVRGHDGNSQYFHDMEPMDHGQMIRENGVPGHVAIMRAMEDYKNIGMNQMSKSSLQTSKESSFMRPPFPHPHQNVHPHSQQHPQDPLSSPQQDRPNLRLNITQASMYQRHHQGGFISPSPTPTTPSTPLQYLQAFAEKKHFQPDEGYRQLMDMKREEEMIQNKQGIDAYNISPQMYHKDGLMYPEGPLSRQKSPVGAPNTFPLRHKSTPQALNKSSSVPVGMKTGESVRKGMFSQ